ncbi:hypothetical protein V491_03696 [Pseudogymnoascus sp. VKM F-3775]|nr:hypothetical protein V491_03696 [Pseudogymnoascus sp. VKM F-3775]
MGLFSKSSSNRTSSKPSISERSASLASSNSSLQSPTLGFGKHSSQPTSSGPPPFSPTTTAPTHRPQIPMPKAPDPLVDPAAYLRSIGSVRARCSVILEKAVENDLNHFDVDMSKFDDSVAFVVSIIKRDFAPDYSTIPPHGRWQHFNVGGKDRVTHLLQSWPSSVDTSERTRRLLDLFLVSVLLDAGAGTVWSYKSKENGKIYRRSEGLAVASLEMFKTGMFSSDPDQPFRVDADGLKRLTVESMGKGLQVTAQNPIAGLDGRANLLIRLSKALGNRQYFGDDSRPGNIIDYLISHPTTQISSVPIVPLPTLWHVLMDGLGPIWPASRTVVDGVSLGDAWPLSSMPRESNSAEWETIVPFHKLTQWLCYSLMQPMSVLMHIHFAGAELMTGLPEYRNGGLFIDTGVLTLKPEQMKRGLERFSSEADRNGQKCMEVVPMFEASDDVVVEWRAVTVGFLDMLLAKVNTELGLSGEEALSLPQMLEAGSWKGGREIAEVTRPNTKEPPIMIISDGTVF